MSDLFPIFTSPPRRAGRRWLVAMLLLAAVGAATAGYRELQWRPRQLDRLIIAVDGELADLLPAVLAACRQLGVPADCRTSHRPSWDQLSGRTVDLYVSVSPPPGGQGLESVEVGRHCLLAACPWHQPLWNVNAAIALAGGPDVQYVSWDAIRPPYKILSVGGVWPTREAVQSGEYPLARSVYLTWRKPRSAWERWLEARHAAARRLPSLIPSLQAAISSRLFSPPTGLRLMVAGDVMLARGVRTRLERLGPDWAFQLVQPLLKQADLAVANLESPLGTSGSPVPGKMIWFRAPPDYALALARGGFGAMILANNHILDYGTDCLMETLDALQRAGVRYVGAGRNLAEARQPLLVEKQGVRLALLAYSDFADIFWSWDYPFTFAATESRAGVAPLRLDYLREDIQKARELADVVAVALHWGEEDTNYPNERQLAVAQCALSWGAQIVLGFHPHALQGLQLDQYSLVAYSLGNFVMDQHRPINTQSMILDLVIDQRGVRAVNVIPCQIEQCRPRPLADAEAAQLLGLLQRWSRAIEDP